MASRPTVKLDADALVLLRKRYRGRSLAFAKEILKRSWDTWQIAAFEALDAGEVRRMSRTAAHGVGKSWFAAAVALHRLCTLHESQTFLTSATFAQLNTRLWPTVVKLANESIIPNFFEYDSRKLRIKGLTTSWVVAQPWSKVNPEAFAGLHVHAPALIADEASAIDDIIFESWEGSMQHPESFMLLLGNPLYRTGELFLSHNAKKHLYDHAAISGLDSLYTSKAWIEEIRTTYGEDSDVYRVRCLGQFPQSEAQGFIPEALVRQNVRPTLYVSPTEPVMAGLDVARYGTDASVLAIRQGTNLVHLSRWRKADPMDVCEEVARLIDAHNVALCCVDAHGVGGPVADRLRKLRPGKIIDINLSADGGKQYYNNRARLWGLSRDWLVRGASLPTDPEIVSSAISLMSSFDKSGRIQLESKELARKRGVSSPDSWDAIAYTFAATPPSSPQYNTPAHNNPRTPDLRLF